MNTTLQNFFASKLYHAGISAVILTNCLVLGLETSMSARAFCGVWLNVVDNACLIIFVVELLCKIFTFKLTFFTGKEKGWNLFDFIIVSISLLGNSTLTCFVPCVSFGLYAFYLCCLKCV